MGTYILHACTDGRVFIVRDGIYVSFVTPFMTECATELIALANEALAKREAEEIRRSSVAKMDEAAHKTLRRLGYTYEGGEEWKPPLTTRIWKGAPLMTQQGSSLK